MENTILKYHLLQDIIDETEGNKLNDIAFQYRRFSRIYFKLISIKDHIVTIHVRQEKNNNEKYLDAATLEERAKDLFTPTLSLLGYELKVSAFPFVESVVEVVTPAYIQAQMKALKIKPKDLVKDTGADKTNISSWTNGVREMSQPVKAMFYYYFLHKSANNND